MSFPRTSWQLEFGRHRRHLVQKRRLERRMHRVLKPQAWKWEDSWTQVLMLTTVQAVCLIEFRPWPIELLETPHILLDVISYCLVWVVVLTAV
jgi:hypothetical protein